MKNPRWLIVLALIVVAAVAAGGLYWFFRDNAPAEVSLDAATSGSQPQNGGDRSGTGELAGRWVVDGDAGGFDFKSATGTFAGFRVEEELANIGSATAVGRTGEVGGYIEIEGTELTKAKFEIDMRAMTTNQSRRDSKVQQALETETFPTATFELTAPVDFGKIANGGTVKASATGNLTIHGVSNKVEIPLEAKLHDGAITIVGSTPVRFADYDVTVPSSPIVLSVKDQGTLEFQIHMKR